MFLEGDFAEIRERSGKELAAGGTGANLLVSQRNWTLCGAGDTRQLFTALSASIFHSLSTRLAPPSTPHTTPLDFPSFPHFQSRFFTLWKSNCTPVWDTFPQLSGKGIPSSLSRTPFLFSRLPSWGALVSLGSCQPCQ